MQVQFLSQEDPPEKEMATHSSILPWEILWTEEPGGLQSMGLQRVRHDLETKQWQQEHDETILYVMLWWPLLWTQGPLPVSHSQGQIYKDSLPLSLLPISNMKDLSTYLPLLGREGNSTKYGLAHQTGSGSIHVPPFVGSTSCLVAQTDSSISLGSLSSIKHG